MAEFVWLRQWDVLPAVAAAQALLVRTGAKIAVDGNYGPKTKAAVQEFQRARHLSADGVIGQITWPRLQADRNMPICDCIDVFDPDLYTSERQFLTNVGGRPIVIGGMSNGIEQAVQDIISQQRNIFLLRFHGHGAPGVAGASDGHGLPPQEGYHNSSFQNDQPTRRALARLRGAFGPFGCIQFMHCKTARGMAGQRFLQMVADQTGVPASGGVQDQYAGTLRETVRYEGPTRTFCPGGVSLRDWAAALPALPGLTPA